MMHGIEQHLKAGIPRASPWVSQRAGMDNVQDAGFVIVINEPVNAIGDGVILVRK